LAKNVQIDDVKMLVACLVVHTQYQINIKSIASHCGLNATRSIVRYGPLTVSSKQGNGPSDFLNLGTS